MAEVAIFERKRAHQRSKVVPDAKNFPGEKRYYYGFAYCICASDNKSLVH